MFSARFRLIVKQTDAKALDFSFFNIGDDGISALASNIHQIDVQKVRELYVGGNSLTPNAGIQITPILGELANVQIIEFGKNRFGVRSSAFRNCIGDEGIFSFSIGLKLNNSLIRLGLSANNISAKGVMTLCSALESKTTLEVLDFEENIIGDEGAKAVAELMKKLPNLKDINLRACQLTGKGMSILLGASNKNTCLIASSNDFSLSNGFQFILESYQKGVNAYHLGISNTKFGNAECEMLLKVKPQLTIKSFDLTAHELSSPLFIEFCSYLAVSGKSINKLAITCDENQKAIEALASVVKSSRMTHLDFNSVLLPDPLGNPYLNALITTNKEEKNSKKAKNAPERQSNSFENTEEVRSMNISGELPQDIVSLLSGTALDFSGVLGDSIAKSNLDSQTTQKKRGNSPPPQQLSSVPPQKKHLNSPSSQLLGPPPLTSLQSQQQQHVNPLPPPPQQQTHVISSPPQQQNLKISPPPPQQNKISCPPQQQTNINAHPQQTNHVPPYPQSSPPQNQQSSPPSSQQSSPPSNQLSSPPQNQQSSPQQQMIAPQRLQPPPNKPYFVNQNSVNPNIVPQIQQEKQTQQVPPKPGSQ